MSKELRKINEDKESLHSRNQHRSRYDFQQLINNCQELAPFVFLNEYEHESIDFSNPKAVKVLNRALLKCFYGIGNWDVPENYLCPPIPGRADYIHYMADLLGACNNEVVPIGKSISVLDIGVGANCVYPIIGHKEYGWHFVGSDIDPIAIRSAKNIIASNPSLSNFMECRQQNHLSSIFRGIVKQDEVFDISICNPPFHSSLAEAKAGTYQKWKNLGIKKTTKSNLNFGGQNSELWCKGGELGFVSKMIMESAQIPKKCFWFSSLVSKKLNLEGIYKVLQKVTPFEVKTIPMAQGQKKSRIVAWTFLDKIQQKQWQLKRWH